METINDETIKKVAKEAAKEALLEFDKELKDKRIYNTRLLMKNYNKFKEHIDNVKTDIEFDIEEAEDKVWLTSVVRTKLRTMQMMAYIDCALDIIKDKMKMNCVEYKYKAFELYYKEEKTNEEIIEALGCGKNQPKIWSDLVIDDLSIYLWGIEALGI